MRRIWAMVVAGVLVAVLLAACQRGASAPLGPTATVPTAPPQTTTTNPYAVPAVIDTAYVNRVLAGLDQALGDVVRLIVQTRTIPPEAVDRLKALYGTQDSLNLALKLFSQELAGGLKGYLPQPGDPRTTVAALVSVSTSCVFARVDRDASALARTVDPRLRTQWVALQPAMQAPDPFGLNPTRWMFIYDGFQPGFVAPRDPCRGS